MSDNDKPFACPVAGCGLTFTNNDRLIVHRQTHSLRVKIGPKGEDSIPDQTPTPTRFLRNCDEEGLFEELGENVDNPFEKDFKKNLVTGQPIGIEKKSTESTAVNTPVPVVTESPISSKESAIVDIVSTNNAGERVGVAPPAIQTVVIDGRVNIPNASDFLSQTAEQTAEQEQDTKVTVQSPTVSVLVARNNTSSRKVVPAFIAHPDNAVPKAIPAPLTIVSNGNLHSIQTRAIVVTPTGTGKSGGSFVKSAKQILKETIRIHQSQGKDVKTSLGSIIDQAMDEAVSAVKRPSSGSEPGNDGEDIDARPIKRNRRSQDDLSADEKRERFLERNRAAATRCREKRKLWVQALEKKAEEMSELNSQLQNEISCLKHEVAELKGLLLAHRNCPLSINQQKAHPGIFEQLAAGNEVIITAEETATSALAQMAEQTAAGCNI